MMSDLIFAEARRGLAEYLLGQTPRPRADGRGAACQSEGPGPAPSPTRSRFGTLCAATLRNGSLIMRAAGDPTIIVGCWPSRAQIDEMVYVLLGAAWT